MSTTQHLKWGDTLAEPFQARKRAEQDFLDTGRPEAFGLKTRPGAALVELFDAVQKNAVKAGWVVAMDQAGRALRTGRALRALHSKERRFVADVLHDMVRGLRRLRAIVGESRPSAATLYVAWLLDRKESRKESRNESRNEGPSPSARGLADAALLGLDAQALLGRRTAIDERLLEVHSLPPDAQIDAIGDALSYPGWLVRALRDDLGLVTALALLKAQNTRAPLTVRANAIRCDRETLAARLEQEGIATTKTAWSRFGLTLEENCRVNIYGTQAFADGLLEIQDEGSQLISELCAPPPGSVVVDVCAGAGGKTLALGALLANKGRIVAMDIDGHKLEELSRRARRAGLSNIQTVRLPADWAQSGGLYAIPDWLRSRGAERVLVDAPCSGLGVLRRHPEARWHMQPADIDELVIKQRAILSAASALVRRDGKSPGRLIYATCTLTEQENAGAVDAFLRTHPDFSNVAIKEILGGERAAAIGDGERLRLVPKEGGPDGFFAAVLRRTG